MRRNSSSSSSNSPEIPISPAQPTDHTDQDFDNSDNEIWMELGSQNKESITADALNMSDAEDQSVDLRKRDHSSNEESDAEVGAAPRKKRAVTNNFQNSSEHGTALNIMNLEHPTSDLRQTLQDEFQEVVIEDVVMASISEDETALLEQDEEEEDAATQPKVDNQPAVRRSGREKATKYDQNSSVAPSNAAAKNFAAKPKVKSGAKSGESGRSTRPRIGHRQVILSSTLAIWINMSRDQADLYRDKWMLKKDEDPPMTLNQADEETVGAWVSNASPAKMQHEKLIPWRSITIH